MSTFLHLRLCLGCNICKCLFLTLFGTEQELELHHRNFQSRSAHGRSSWQSSQGMPGNQTRRQNSAPGFYHTQGVLIGEHSKPKDRLQAGGWGLDFGNNQQATQYIGRESTLSARELDASEGTNHPCTSTQAAPDIVSAPHLER